MRRDRENLEMLRSSLLLLFPSIPAEFYLKFNLLGIFTPFQEPNIGGGKYVSQLQWLSVACLLLTVAHVWTEESVLLPCPLFTPFRRAFEIL